MAGRLLIPYLTVNGPIAVKARCMRPHDCKLEGCPKYMGEDGVTLPLFNTPDLLKDADVLYLCEGELDAVLASGVLGVPCVAFPGTSSWRPFFARAIGPDWGAVRVIADGDPAGREAAKEIARHLRARVIRMPDGHDLSSFYMEHGRGETLARLEASDV